MKHLSPVSKAPQPAGPVLDAFFDTKRETIENATHLKDFL